MSVYLCAFLMDVGLVIFWASMPYLAKDWFHAGPSLLGIIGGCGAGTYVLTCLLAGRLAKRFGRRRMIAVGAFIVAVISASMPFARTPGYLVFAAMAHAVGHGFFWPALEAQFSAGTGPTELRHRVGLFNLSWSSGDIMGALCGGALYSFAGILAARLGVASLQALPFLVVSTLSLTIVLLALAGLHKTPQQSSWRDEHDHNIPKSPGRGGHSGLAVFLVIALIANGAAIAFRGILINIFPDMGKDLFGYSALQWGILLAMIPFWRTIMFLWWRRSDNWAYRVRLLFAFQLLLPAAALIIVFNSSYWIFLLTFALAGIGMSKTYVSSIYYSLDSDHSHELRGGLHEAALGSGSAIAPPLAGLIARVSGWERSPYVFAFFFLCAGILTQIVLYLRRRRSA